MSTAAAPIATPRLIDGRTIDAKNTLQSFDHLVPQHQPVPLLNTVPGLVRNEDDKVREMGGEGAAAVPNTDVNPHINHTIRNSNNNQWNRNDARFL